MAAKENNYLQLSGSQAKNGRIQVENPNKPPKFESLNPTELDFIIPVSASVIYVDPSTLSSDGFELQDQTIIPNTFISSSFTPGENFIEFYIYDAQKNLLTSNYDWEDWTILENSNTELPSGSYVDTTTGLNVIEESPTTLPTNEVVLNPASNIYNQGFENGVLYASYNFVNYELGSSPDNTFYLSEISSDRTEIALRSNTIDKNEIKRGYISLKTALSTSEFFDEFYVSFFNNEYAIGINVLGTGSVDSPADTILIKLYEPLPTQYNVKDELYVASKVGESKAYKVEFIEDLSSFIEQANFIKGPNINIPLKDLINNSTTLKSYEDLTSTPSSESLNNLLNTLNQKGVVITPNYSYNTFNEFINFSSAKERINNFYEKVSQIQSYEADIETITKITGSNPDVKSISSSLASLQTNISNLITNFDGYETYLYNISSSYAYPKASNVYPYPLLSTGSVEVLEWLGSDVENSQYYGGYVLSASLYDQNNQNWLYYTIPSFITENSNNNEYVEFSNMVGQSFDEIWLYTRALSERYNTTNDPDSGLPLGLAAEAIKGLGFETFGNNYNNQDNFIGLTGEDNGSYVPPTGSEWITQYIAVNSGSVYNYWSDNYAWIDYVQQINDPGFPYAIDKVSKEIFKRLYHNMAYLTKKKGTISGLRQLINIWGIPNTILRINEFGGKNRDNSNDYDLWYNRFSYAYTPVANTYAASSSVRIPWMPLERNRIADSEYIVPDGLAFRFKTTGFPSSNFGGSYYTQSLVAKKSNGVANSEMDFGISLFYEDQPSGSYSGSSNSDYYEYGKMRFYISASTAQGGVIESNDIFLPFFNKGWWSVLLQRDTHVSASENTTPTTYTLQVANNLYNGVDGNVIGWTGSVNSAITGVTSSANQAWNSFGVSEIDGIYLGGYVSGSNVVTEVLNENGKIFSGSLQEFRYYSNDIPTEVFHDFAMNPESIEGNNITGSESSFDIVNFRAPLGNELEYLYTASQYGDYIEPISSSHPAITGSANLVITASFVNPANDAVTSSYDFIHYSSSVLRTYSKPNTEVYQLDQPAVGIRNRVSNKIQVEDGDAYGNVLSRQVSIDQNYLISKSYTEDVTNLEVAFSPQDEVNDDIIASFGYGVISDTIADPRYTYDSKLNYYPRLRNVAIDYFKKYTEGNVYDYLRLIKYFDNSLFKAIKSYVPARTSVTTGVLIKQNLLERNRRPSVTITPNTTVARTPETGSYDGIPTEQKGLNSAIQLRDLELTGSFDVASIDGGAGGVVNPFNVLHTQSGYFDFYSQTSPGAITTTYQNLLAAGGIGNGYNNIVYPTNIPGDLGFTSNIKTRFGIRQSNAAAGGLSAGTVVVLAISSSIRGIIGEELIPSSSLSPFDTVVSTSFYEFTPEEEIGFYFKRTTGGGNWNYVNINTLDLDATSPYTSSIHNQVSSQSYIERNETISGSIFSIKSSQDEFYNGEYSGSNLTVTTQSLLYNPYSTLQLRNTQYYITASSGIAYPNISQPFPYIDYPQSLTEIGPGGLGAQELIVKVFTNIDDAWTWINAWFTSGYANGKNFICLFLSDVGIVRKYYIVAAFINRFDSTGADYITTVLPGVGVNEYIKYQGRAAVKESQRLTLNDPFDAPYFNDWIDSDFTSSLNDIGINTLSPIFQFAITGSLNGTTLAPGNEAIFKTYFNGTTTVKSNHIHSTLFPADAANIGYYVVGGVGGGGTPKGLLVTTPDASSLMGEYNVPGVSYASLFYLTIEIDKLTYPNAVILDSEDAAVTQTPFTSVSNYHVSLSQAITRVNGKAPGYLHGPSSGSFFQYRQTFLGTDVPDSYTYTPLALALNKFSIDPTTNQTYDNTSTLLANPTFQFKLDASLQVGLAPPIINSLSGSEFYQGLTDKVGPLLTIDDPNSNNLYWYYNSGSRTVRWTDYNGVGTTALWIPAISQSAQLFNFNPSLVGNPLIFDNSPFNTLFNNATGSEKNTYVQELDYGNGIDTPTNLQAIIDNTATKAQVNDSFYTTQASILPRYLGTKITSADYNLPTQVPSGSFPQGITSVALERDLFRENKIRYKTGETGSWTGDNSFGQTAVIESNPIYFAHFKSSRESREVFNSTTFDIDQLIQVPMDDIKGSSNLRITSSRVNGNNDNLIPVSSTFTPGRNASVIYNNAYRNFSSVSSSLKLEYTSLTVGSVKILAGGQEFSAYWSNQLLPQLNSVTQSYDKPDFLYTGLTSDTLVVTKGLLTGSIGGAGVWAPGYVDLPTSLSQSSAFTQTFSTQSAVAMAFTASSNYSTNRGFGLLQLQGPPADIEFPLPVEIYNLGAENLFKIVGPTVSTLNSINTVLNMGVLNSSSVYDGPNPTSTMTLVTTTFPSSINTGSYWGCSSVFSSLLPNKNIAGSTSGAGRYAFPIINDINDPNNYYTYNFSGSKLGVYPQPVDTKLLIEKGDEIRISYISPTVLAKSTANPPVITQDFTVIDYELPPPLLISDSNDFVGNTTLTFSGLATSASFQGQGSPINPYSVDEVYRRFQQAIENETVFFAANNNNKTQATIGYGIISSVTKTSTSVTVTCLAIDWNSPTTTTSSKWLFGTNSQLIRTGTIPPTADDLFWRYGPILSNTAASDPYNNPLDPAFIYDRVIVHPDPSTLALKVPKGSIYNMTIRKRVSTDDRVVLNQISPSGSKGSITPSGDGYIIPNDLSAVQRRNVNELIIKLKSNNAFIQDNTSEVSNWGELDD